MYFFSLPYDPDSPTILYNKGVLTFKGRCIPSNAEMTWIPIVHELERYCARNDQIIVNFKFNYYNTSTGFWVIRLLNILDEFCKQGNQVTINWYYLNIDEDMEDAGNIFRDMLSCVIINVINLK